MSLGPPRGFTLVELLVALALSSLIVGGALELFMTGRSTLRVAESQARMREAAGFALAALETDVAMAGFWGLTAEARVIEGRAGSSAPLGVVPRGACADRWASDLARHLDGTNNGYALDCRPYRGRASPVSDTLIVRRADGEALDSAEPGRLYVHTRLAGSGTLFLGPAAPADSPPLSEVHELRVDAYYVSPTSSLSTAERAVPSLRVKRLTGGPAGPRVVDEEVAPGIEDLQVEFGVDLDPPGSLGHGSVDAWVRAGEAPLSTAAPGVPVPVVAVRLWVRVCAEAPEIGFIDDRTYEYSDLPAWMPGDDYRRAVFSTTVFVRNARAE